MYSAKKITRLEKIKLLLSPKYRSKHEETQKRIIREMVTSGKFDPVLWEGKHEKGKSPARGDMALKH